MVYLQCRSFRMNIAQPARIALRCAEKREVPAWLGAARRALGIVRVSSRKQLDNNSPNVQRDGIVAYACRDLELDLVRVEELHESAKRSDACVCSARRPNASSGMNPCAE